jgi:coenzyme F420-reducing hydrogenase gamma subunit
MRVCDFTHSTDSTNCHCCATPVAPKDKKLCSARCQYDGVLCKACKGPEGLCYHCWVDMVGDIRLFIDERSAEIDAASSGAQ